MAVRRQPAGEGLEPAAQGGTCETVGEGFAHHRRRPGPAITATTGFTDEDARRGTSPQRQAGASEGGALTVKGLPVFGLHRSATLARRADCQTAAQTGIVGSIGQSLALVLPGVCAAEGTGQMASEVTGQAGEKL